MPFFEISDEELKTIDSEILSKFKSYEPEDVEGLKTNANKILQEKKQVEADLAKAQADMKALKVSGGAKPDEKSIAQLEDALKQIDDYKSKIDELNNANKRSKLQSEASRLAAEVCKTDARRQKLLAEKISARLDIDGDNFTVLDSAGKPTISSTKDLMGQLNKEYDFLFDGSQASGGGASGGSGGAASSKTIKFSEYKALSPTEKGQLRAKDITVIDD